MLLQYVVLLIMLIGLFCTFLPRIPGALIILGGSLIYGLMTEFVSYRWETMFAMILLTVVSEIGSKLIRLYLTNKYNISKILNTNTAVGGVAGLVVTDVIFGPVFGTVLWGLLSGKTLVPNWKSIVRVTVRLASAALVRFICGLAMIGITILYIFS